MDLFNVPVTCPINRYFLLAGNMWNKTLTFSCSDSLLRCYENEEHYCIMSLPLKILFYSFNQSTLFDIHFHCLVCSDLFWCFCFCCFFCVLISFPVFPPDPLFCFVTHESLFVCSSAAFAYLTFSACNMSRTVVVILLANRLIAFWWRNQAVKLNSINNTLHNSNYLEKQGLKQLLPSFTVVPLSVSTLKRGFCGN